MRAQHRLVDVPYQLEESALVVNQQHNCIAGVDHPFVFVCHGFLQSPSE